MNKPQYFMQSKPKETATPGKPINWAKGVILTFVFVFAIGLFGYVFMQFKGVYDKVSQNWNEIKFAYEKPHLISAIREDYELKQRKLDQSFVQKEKSAEEKLVDEVVNKLKTAENLK